MLDSQIRKSKVLHNYPSQPQQFFDELVSLSVSLFHYPTSDSKKNIQSAIIPYGSRLFAGMGQLLWWKFLAENKFLTNILIISYNPESTSLSFSPYNSYDSGLGKIELDQSRFFDELKRNGFSTDHIFHDSEALFSQLPFIRFFAHDKKIGFIERGEESETDMKKLLSLVKNHDWTGIVFCANVSSGAEVSSDQKNTKLADWFIWNKRKSWHSTLPKQLSISHKLQPLISLVA